MRKLILLMVFLAAGIRSQESAPAAFLPPSPNAAALEAGIAAAVAYLNANALPNGEFTYRRHCDGRRYTYKNNLLRHSGTVYALGMARAFRPQAASDARTAAVIANANKYLQSFIAPVAANGEILTVWSPEERLDARALKGSPIVAKLGAAGLGILALLSDAGSAAANLPAAQKIGAFILTMQRPDGSFVSRTIAGKTDDDEFESLYYPGEAMLALLWLYERDRNPQWLAAALRGMKHLAVKRRATGQYLPDHWALIASSVLWQHRNAWSPERQKTAGSNPPPLQIAEIGMTEALLCGHAAEICRLMLSEQWTVPSLAGEFGCFRLGGLTCPTATRVEGLLAAYDFLPRPPYGELCAAIRTACGHATAFLLQAQLKDGPLAGGVPRSSTADIIRFLPRVPVVPVPLSTPGMFYPKRNEQRRGGEVRIDYVQHTLSAFIRYRRLLAE